MILRCVLFAFLGSSHEPLPGIALGPADCAGLERIQKEMAPVWAARRVYWEVKPVPDDFDIKAFREGKAP